MSRIGTNLKDIYLEILSHVKFELEFHKDKENPMFERIMKTRRFQQKLQNLKEFIFQYYDLLYKDKENPVTRAALKEQLNNLSRLINYYDDLSNFYDDLVLGKITKEKFKEIIDYSHIQLLFLILTSILDWEHYRNSFIFPEDKEKEKEFKQFLTKIASEEIKSLDDILDLEQKIFQDLKI